VDDRFVTHIQPVAQHTIHPQQDTTRPDTTRHGIISVDTSLPLPPPPSQRSEVTTERKPEPEPGLPLPLANDNDTGKIACRLKCRPPYSEPLLYTEHTHAHTPSLPPASLYSCPNPTVSSTAIVSLPLSASYVLYGGRSSRLKLRMTRPVSIEQQQGKRETRQGEAYQVCDLGSCVGSPDFSTVNLRGPSLPWRSLKPLTGMREVPVANWRRRDFCSASQLRIHCMKQKWS